MKPEECGLEDDLDLGSCCCCGKTGPSVSNIIMLNKKGPIPGKGWGCVVCGLPLDGAVYVCCDECLGKKAEPFLVCNGSPISDGRAPIEELTEDFHHDLSLHKGER